jgi:lysozyme
MGIPDLLSQLNRDEGRKKFPYLDTKGKLTIGVGRNLTDRGISDDEIDYLCQNDIRLAENTCRQQLPWFSNLDPIRQAVIVNMMFNLGLEKFDEFQQMAMAVARGNWGEAARQMQNSLWAQEVGDRAVRLANQMEQGVWF